MRTWIVKVIDENGYNSDGQEYYKHYNQEPTEADYQELERQGYRVVGTGSIEITEVKR